jgi:uncharacterized DUF497 family protein
MQFDGFDWDDGNRAKCCKHGVDLDEIEQVLSADPLIIIDVRHSLIEERFHAVGRARSRRAVFVVFTIRNREDRIVLRPLSARYMHAREIALYEKAQAVSRSEER